MIHTLAWTFEELGKGMGCGLEVELLLDVDEPEPKTWDYPGSPGGMDVVDAKVTQFLSSTHIIGRDRLGSWAPVLDELALKLAVDKTYEIQERYGEDLADSEEAAREDYYDRKRDELRGC
jgi:hypothetical protein